MHALRLAPLAIAGLLASACVPSMEKLQEMADKPVVYNTNIELLKPAFVACREAPLHLTPDRMAARTGTLRFATAVTPEAFDGYFPLPASQQDKTYRDTPRPPNMSASWTRVTSTKGSGWVATACLADATLMDRQDPEGRLRQVAFNPRGFSEDENGATQVMKGGTGMAQLASCSNGCAAGKRAVDALIAQTPNRDAAAATRSFRSAGRLGEYK